MKSVVFQPIGVVRTPFKSPENMPVQPVGADSVTAQVIIDSDYEAGLQDIEGFSHIYLLYVFHLSRDVRLTVTPYLDTAEHGVFATRSPHRPNPVGLSLTRLLRREGNILHIAGIDVVDGTPVLDIKPYIPDLNARGDVRIGWLEGRTEQFETTVSPPASPTAAKP